MNEGNLSVFLSKIAARIILSEHANCTAAG